LEGIRVIYTHTHTRTHTRTHAHTHARTLFMLVFHSLSCPVLRHGVAGLCQILLHHDFYQTSVDNCLMSGVMLPNHGDYAMMPRGKVTRHGNTAML